MHLVRHSLWANSRAATGTGLWPCRLALAMATAGTVTLAIPTYWLWRWLWLCARVSPGVKYLKATSLQLSLTVVVPFVAAVVVVVAAVIAISKELQKLILLSCRGVMLQCFSCCLPGSLPVANGKRKTMENRGKASEAQP